MLTLASHARIFMYAAPVDMRKSFEGLSFLVERHIQETLVEGGYFVFINKQKDRMKVLYWDGDGFVIWYKRLERGRFCWKGENTIRIERKAFFMLLEGIIPKKIQKRYSAKKG